MGGAEKSMLFLADSLQKTNLAENIMAVPQDSFLFKEAKEKNIEAVPFSTRGSLMPAAIVKLIRIVRKHKIDIIHAHQGKLYWTALAVKLFCRSVKVVLHRRQDTRHKFYSRLHYSLADAVIAVSKAVADGLVKYEKVPADKIKVVYNGVNFERMGMNAGFGDVVKEYGLEGKTVIGTAGAIVDFKGKGQIYLIEAAKQMRNEYPDLRCLIVGSGKGLEEQKAYAKKLGVDDIVFFTGYQNQVQKYISAMDIFCLLSWDTEGMPNVVIEAQSLQKPVVVTNVGGNPEAFADGETGILIKPSSAQEVVSALKKLISDKALATRYGKAGKEFVENKFTVENMVSNTLEVYKSISRVESEE